LPLVGPDCNPTFPQITCNRWYTTLTRRGYRENNLGACLNRSPALTRRGGGYSENDLGSCLNRSSRMPVNLGNLWDGILFMNPSNSLNMFTKAGSRIFLLAANVW